MEFGKHAAFIWASYSVSAIVLGALIVRAFMMKSDD